MDKSRPANMWSRLAWALVLAAVAGLSVANCLAAIGSKAIDGPGRGIGLIVMDQHPTQFWLTVGFNLLVALAAGTAALSLARRKR
jgi:hypothetical protein